MISGFRSNDGARVVGAAVVAVPGERSEPRGRRQRLANAAALIAYVDSHQEKLSARGA
jgi:hypothetical protein